VVWCLIWKRIHSLRTIQQSSDVVNGDLIARSGELGTVALRDNLLFDGHDVFSFRGKCFY